MLCGLARGRIALPNVNSETAPAFSDASISDAAVGLRVLGFGPAGEAMAFERGAFNVVLGRNGAGKTALCRLVAGLDAAEGARVLTPERELTELDARARKVALVFGEFVNYPGLSVLENIALPLRAAGAPPVVADARAREMAERTGLEDLLDRLPEQLSGGQQQRVALARAIARDPDVLLLDEPLANLDYKLRESMEDELRALFAGSSTTLVYTTSDPREALQLADRLVMLDAGRPIAQGAPLALLERPDSVAAADLLCDPALNVARAHRAVDAFELEHGPTFTLPARTDVPDGPCLIGIRPDHLRLSAQAEADTIAIDAEVLFTETTGSDTYVHLRVGAEDWVAHLDGLHGLAAGSAARFAVAVPDVLCFPVEGMR